MVAYVYQGFKTTYTYSLHQKGKIRKLSRGYVDYKFTYIRVYILLL